MAANRIPTRPEKGDQILPWAEGVDDFMRWNRRRISQTISSYEYWNRFPFQVEMGLNTDGTPDNSTIWVRGGYWIIVTDIATGEHSLVALQGGDIDNTESVDISATTPGALELWLKLDTTGPLSLSVETSRVDAEGVFWELLAEIPTIDDGGTTVVNGRIEQRWRGGDIMPGTVGLKEHNDLGGLQGGDPVLGEFFHLSEAQLDQLIEDEIIDPVPPDPADCNQNIHPGTDDGFNSDNPHPGDGEDTEPGDDPDGFVSHPGYNDCYTSVPPTP